MQEKNMIELTGLDNGESARVVELCGGHRFTARLESMGIVPGAVIVKKSDTPLHGPVVLEKGAMRLAIGYGMARRIMVEPFKKRASSK
jgi:ferrous iron transport protein A